MLVNFKNSIEVLMNVLYIQIVILIKEKSILIWYILVMVLINVGFIDVNLIVDSNSEEKIIQDLGKDMKVFLKIFQMMKDKELFIYEKII